MSELPAPTSGAHTDAAPDISYEQAKADLTDVVRELESGHTSLTEAMTLWEKGERLATICQQWLDGAQARIDASTAQPSDHDEAN